MTVILKGHDYKYAVEQMLLTLFPDERPTYGTDEENRVTVSLHRGNTWLTAAAASSSWPSTGRAWRRWAKSRPGAP